MSGATIVLDQRIGHRTQTPVSAVFKNTIPLRAAVQVLAEMADLLADVRENLLFVTNKSAASSAEHKRKK